MSILEIAIANRIFSRRGEKPDQEYYEEDGLAVLLRIAVAFAGFAIFLLWLQGAACP